MMRDASMAGIVMHAATAIIFIVVTIDVTLGPDRKKPRKTGRTAIFPITVTKVSFNLLFQ